MDRLLLERGWDGGESRRTASEGFNRMKKLRCGQAPPPPSSPLSLARLLSPAKKENPFEGKPRHFEKCCIDYVEYSLSKEALLQKVEKVPKKKMYNNTNQKEEDNTKQEIPLPIRGDETERPY